MCRFENISEIAGTKQFKSPDVNFFDYFTGEISLRFVVVKIMNMFPELTKQFEIVEST